MGPENTEDISLDALIFFATHSLIVIALAAVVFFCLGLLFGFLTWAKYKRRARAFSEEVQLQRSEIANLKRRIAHEAVDASGAVLGLPEEATPLLSMSLFEAARTLLPEPSLEEPPVIVSEPPAEEPKTESLAAAVLRPAKPASAPLRPEPATVTRSDNAGAPPTTIEFPAAEPIALPIQLPEIPSIKMAGSLGVTRALARSVDENGAGAGEPLEDAGTDEVEEALASGRATMDEKLGLIYHERPDRYDDLTLLRGIGEMLHTKLQELGIHTFKQIGTWTEENIREFDQRLLTKDRIRREHWVKQARNLHFLKYGEELKQAVVQTE